MSGATGRRAHNGRVLRASGSRSPSGGARTVQARLVRSATVATAVAVLAMLGVVSLVVTHQTRDVVDAELASRLSAVQTALALDSSGDVVVGGGSAQLVGDVWVFDRGGSLVAGSGTTEPPDPVRALSRTGTERGEVAGGTAYLARPLVLSRGGDAVGVAVASASLAPYRTSRDALLIGLGTVGLLLAVGAALGTAWTVRRTLRPVHEMTVSAAEWSERDLDRRFDLDEGDDELSELARTLDGLLAKVATALRGEQRLTAELAHELRTPLTTIRMEAELAMTHPAAAELGAPLRTVVEQVDRLDATITTLIALARHEHGPGHRSDLVVVVGRQVADRRRPPEWDLELPRGPVWVAASADLVERVLAPVLDNAARYAAARVGVVVVASGPGVAGGPGVVRIDVRDDGPGIDLADLDDVDDIFASGVTDTAHDGAGLGLSLARRVADGLGGTLAVTSPSAPTTFTVTLPAAAPASAPART